LLTTDLDYQLLGVRPGASSEEIREAYRDLIRVWHPDRFEHDSKLRAKAERTTQELNAAYRRLSRSHRGRSRTGPNRKTCRAESRPTVRRTNSSSAAPSEPPAYSRNDTVVTALLRVSLGAFIVIGVLFVGLGVFNARRALPGNGVKSAATTTTSPGSQTGRPSPVRPSETPELRDAAAGQKAVADVPARLTDEQIPPATDRGAPLAAAGIIRPAHGPVPASSRFDVDRPRPASLGNAEHDIDVSPRRVGAPRTAEDVDLALIEWFLKERPRAISSGKGLSDLGVSDRSGSPARTADSLDPGAPIDWLMKKPAR
jgi:hypothetical protein